MKRAVLNWIWTSLLAAGVPTASRAATPCTNGFAGPYPCHMVDLLATMPGSSIGGGNGNDVWGWTDPLTGKEYALAGRTVGTAFVDISSPQNPVYLGLLPTHTVNSVWRDLKVYSNHVFIVADSAGAHGMQVFDLKQLRTVTNPPIAFSNTAHYAGINSAHNIAINEATGFAYAVGANGGTNPCAGGLHMINIQNPTNPVFAGCFSADGYTHDAQVVIYHGPDTNYTGREIAFCSNTDTLTIVDVTVKGAPVQLSRTGYTNSGYTHQGWLTEDHKYHVVDDELDENNFGFNTRTRLFDVSDLTAPVYLGHFSGPTPAIDHNLYIRSNFVYMANYRAGLRIVDAADIANTNLQEIAYFDIYPADNNRGFQGAWSVYPFFASGVVVVNGIGEGLFVLQPNLADLPLADVSVQVGDSPDPVLGTNQITYTLTVSNQGPEAAFGVMLTSVLPGGVRLGTIDQLDDDDSASGFGGGAHSDTQWSAASSHVELTSAGRVAGAGEYVSRVIDTKAVVNWSRLSWLPLHPYGKELPDNGFADIGYPEDEEPEGFAGLLHPEGPGAPRVYSGSRLLLHLNEWPATNGAQILDASGLAHQGMLITGDGATDKSVAGKFVGAIQFDGLDDRVEFSNSVLSATDPAQAQTAVAWIKTGADGAILSQHTNGSPSSFALLVTNGHLACVKGGSNLVTSTETVTNNAWRHVAFSRSTNGSVTLYLDGAEAGTGTDSNVFANAPFAVGAIAPGDSHFSGCLDEVAVFDRELDHHEVQDLHERGLLNLRFQVRAGNDPSFAGQPFVGPDGTAATFYSELLNKNPEPPSLLLSNLSAGRYFQYRTLFETEATNLSPALMRVWIGPDHYDPDIGMVTSTQGTCQGTNPVMCDLGTILPGGTATVTLRVTILTNTSGSVTNTASAATTSMDSGVLNNSTVAVTLVGDTDSDSVPDFVDPDDDNDTLPDDWETAHGFDPRNAADASLDADGDSLTNAQEYVAGTDPLDPEGRLRILSIEIQGGNVLIEFVTAPGKQYQLERHNDLWSGTWTNVPDTGLTGAGGVTQVVVTGGATDSNSYFRIRLTGP